MKTISTLLMAFVMSFSLFAQDGNDQVKLEKEGELTKVTIYYDDGNVHQIGYMKNKELHGEWKSFDQEGNKIAKANYANGNKVGKWFFWNDGKLSEVDYNDNRIVKVNTWDKKDTYVVSK
ncbi:MAG: toxin-antitoxin system YwqK family antitoxin [Psychroflexus sp.]